MPRANQKRAKGGAEKQPEKIRVELNIEKWPGIWQPAKGHTKLATRTLERQVSSRNGDRASSKLIIGFTDLGTLTTEDQRMFYALIRQWENSGKPLGRPVYFSDRVLSRLLRKKGWGTNVIDAITGSLRRLRTIPLRWIRSFHRSDDLEHEYEEEIPFQMLDDLKIITRKSHGHVTNQQGYFQFNRHIETNLQANYTKPLLEEVFFSLQSEIAQLLYTHIDLIMFGKNRYERCTKDLFADLGLTGGSYRYKSNRKQKLQRALQELQGVRLNHGVLKSATIEETVDGHDYKVVFIKTGSRDVAAVEQAAALPEAETVVIHHYAKDAKAKDEVWVSAEQLVRHFHKTFHGVDVHEPQLKEMNQALSLLSQHGLDKAQHVVDFAHSEAAKTNFQAAHFGAILNYASRAIADFERLSKSPDDSQKSVSRPVAAPEPAAAAPRRGQTRLAALTVEQYQVRFDQAKSGLLAQNSFAARHWKAGPQLFEQMIRHRLVRDLETECMDLVSVQVYENALKSLRQNLPL